MWKIVDNKVRICTTRDNLLIVTLILTIYISFFQDKFLTKQACVCIYLFGEKYNYLTCLIIYIE